MHELLDAASDGQTETVDALLHQGAEIDARTHSGWTPLHWAVWQGHPEVVSVLLHSGADVNAPVHDDYGHTSGWTPVYWKKTGPLREIGEVHVEKGWTPLHLAAIQGHLKIAQILLSYGADTTAEIDQRGTPLEWAVMVGQSLIAEILTE
jgi:cytohesin